MPNNIIPDPDFEGWDGQFVESRPDLPPPRHDLGAIARYLKVNNKNYADLTPKELDMFIIKEMR